MKAAETKSTHSQQHGAAEKSAADQEHEGAFFSELTSERRPFFNPSSGTGIQAKFATERGSFFQPARTPAVQMKCADCAAEERKPPEQISEMPTVQRMPAFESDEAGIQRKPTSDLALQPLQRMPAFESDEDITERSVDKIQRKATSGVNEIASTSAILQPKCEACETEEQEQREEHPEGISQVQMMPVFPSSDDTENSKDTNGPAIQFRLTIGQPGDVYEHEADQVASQVMTMPDPLSQPAIQQQIEGKDHQIQPKNLVSKITLLGQRGFASTKKKIQRKENKGHFNASPNLESRLNSSKGGGSPLPDGVRSFMEPRFGADFSQVRAHTDSSAAVMNKELGAQAFTHRNDVYFATGKAPGKNDLTAHELTHVLQQDDNHLQRRPLRMIGIAPKAITSLKADLALNKELQAKEFAHINDIDANQNQHRTNTEIKKYLVTHHLSRTDQKGDVSRKTDNSTVVKTNSNSDTIHRLTQADHLTRGQEVYHLLDGWTSSADSAEILNQFRGLSQSDVNAILNVTALSASLPVFDVYKWLHDDMVTSDWKALMKIFIKVNSVDINEIIAYVVVNDYLEGYTSEEDSKQILEYLSNVTGTQLDAVLAAMEAKAGKKFTEMVDFLFGDMQATDAQALSTNFFGSGSLKAIDYAVYWYANKIQDLLAGYTGIRDSRSVLQNFQRIGGKGEKADTASQIAVLTKLNELTLQRWGQTAEEALMKDMQQEDYDALHKMLPNNLKVYSIEKNFLSQGWDKIVNGYDYVEGFIEYVVCGIAGIVAGIFDAVVSIISGLIDIGFAIKNIIGWLISKASSGRFGRESEENVRNFITSMGEALGAPLDMMSKMWNATKEEASLIEGPFEECQLAIFWVRRVTNIIINIILLIVAGYGAVKAAIEAIEIIKNISSFAEFVSKLGKLPVKLLRKIKSIPGSIAAGGSRIISAIRNFDSIAESVRKTIGLIRLAATDKNFWLNLRKASGEFIESKIQAEKDWWAKRKEVWNSSATAEEGKIAQSEKLADTATNEAETNPAGAEQKAIQAEDQALDAQHKTNNVEKELKSGQTAEDRAAKQPPGVKSPEFEAWEKGLSPETRALLDSDPELRKFWQDMDPDVRRALTYCNTPCIPLNAHEWPEVLTQIKNLQQRLKLPAEHRGLREYLHIYRNNRQELSDALKALDSINDLKELEAFLDNKLIALIKESYGVTIRRGADGLWEYPRPDGTVIREFEIGPHSYLSVDRAGTRSFFQSHHGIQDVWAKNRFKGLGVYSREDAPTLLLRTRNLEGGARGTPHNLISDRQNARSLERTFAQERAELAKDMDIIGAPATVKGQYLAEVNKYFKMLFDQLTGKLSQDDLKAIFGFTEWPY